MPCSHAHDGSRPGRFAFADRLPNSWASGGLFSADPTELRDVVRFTFVVAVGHAVLHVALHLLLDPLPPNMIRDCGDFFVLLWFARVRFARRVVVVLGGDEVEYLSSGSDFRILLQLGSLASGGEGVSAARRCWSLCGLFTSFSLRCHAGDLGEDARQDAFATGVLGRLLALRRATGFG